MADINLKYPYIISAVISFIAVIISILLYEEKNKTDNIEVDIKDYTNKYFKIIKDSFFFIVKNNYIRWFFLFFTFCIVIAHIFFELQQPYYNSSGVPLYLFGVFAVTISIIQSIISSQLDRITKFVSTKKLLYIVPLIYTIFLLLSGLLFGVLGIVFLILRGVPGGIYKTLTNKYIQKEVNTKIRATIISFLSLTGRLVVSITIVFTGFLLKQLEISIVLIILSSIFMLFYLILMIIKPKQL